MAIVCDICVEPLNKSSHAPSTCNHCGLVACKTCIRTYLNSSAEPHCMKCNFAWDDEFVLMAVNKTYYHSELKEKKKERFAEIEKSRLPLTQNAAKNYLIHEIMINDVRAIDKENDLLLGMIYSNKKKTKAIREKARLEMGNSVVERKEFIMRCQVSECNGFLSTGYKCELCNKTTCSKCLEVIGSEHECNPTNVASAEMIKKETKPCPKCSTRIHKIDGCNQMWCTNCNTPWDWISGKIANGTIHNPHYYEYLKTQNAGIIPRNPGDIICGGLPDMHILQDLIRNLPTGFSNVIQFIRNNVFPIHRIIVETHARIVEFNYRDYFESNLTSARVQFMLNRITDEIFKQQVYVINCKRDKARANIRLLELIETIGTDLLQNFIKQFDTGKTINDYFEGTCKLITEFNELIVYYESLRQKKYNLFKQSGVYFVIKRNGGREGPIEMIDKFIYHSIGQI